MVNLNTKEREIENASVGARYGGRAAVRFLTPRILLGLCAFFCAQATLPFGAKPFGVALLAATTGWAVLPVYLGLSVSAFVTMEAVEGLMLFGIYTALLLVRALVNLAKGAKGVPWDKNADIKIKKLIQRAFVDRVGARVLISATFGLALGCVVLFFGGLLYYDLFALLLLVLISPLTTALLCAFFDYKARKKGEVAELWRDLGFLTLACITVFGARESVLFGVSVAVFGSFLATFLISYLRGVGYGAILGLALGICYSPMLSPMFVIAAISAGIFIRFSPALACFCAFAASSAWAFYVEGLSALLGVFGGILSACLLYSVLHKIIFVDFAKDRTVEKKESVTKNSKRIECAPLPESALDGIKLYEMNSRMSAVSDGLRKLSSFFEEVKQRSRQLENDIEKSGEKYNYCFSNPDETPDYAALSTLLTKTMEQSENDYKIDVELSKRLCLVLTELNLSTRGVMVFGVRKKTIYIRGKNRDLLEENAQNIIEAIAPVLPFAIDSQGFEIRREGTGEQGAILVFEKQALSTSVVRRRVAAKGEVACGDSTSVFKNKDDRFFAMLSDGMGSGRVASAVSQICTGFISNMLSIGSMNAEILSMLNSFLCGRRIGGEVECSATLDFMEVDLMTGRAEIYKCGAAPGYIYRRGKLFKMRSKTMPIGILREVDVKRFSLELCSGDIVVMVSDGVTGEGGECPWLFDLLAKNLPCRSLERTAELIVKYSQASGSVDDVSVLLVEIK